MSYVLLFAFGVFCFLVPPLMAVVACVMLLIMATVIKATTQLVTGADATLAQALQAVGLALLFHLIAQSTILSFLYGTKGEGARFLASVPFSGWMLWAYIGVFYVAAFSIALGTRLGASLLIAAISTAASMLAFKVGTTILPNLL